MAEPIVLEGDALVRVVGTSHYQEALVALTGRQGDGEIRREVLAQLVPEPDNPHDPDAVAVRVDDQLVGYLSRDENRRWLDVLALAAPDAVSCEAMIAGRGGTTGLGVFLRLPTPTEARAQIGIRMRKRAG